MRLSFHGGMCCGIKHIYELGTEPDDVLGPLFSAGGGCAGYDVGYDFCDQTERVCRDEAPGQTYKERLYFYIDFLKEHRPGGIVEITLVTNGGYWSQKKWIPILKDIGFVEVTPEGGIYNSNSGNNVRVFHLYMEDSECQTITD